MGNRTVVLKRKTKETDIKLTLDMDAKGVEIDTPVAFFNHMLTAMAFHGGFALKVKADGDVDVDPHHLVEDIGLVLGDALAKSAEKAGVPPFHGAQRRIPPGIFRHLRHGTYKRILNRSLKQSPDSTPLHLPLRTEQPPHGRGPFQGPWQGYCPVLCSRRFRPGALHQRPNLIL